MLLDKAIAGCKADEVEEIHSLGDTLERWRTEILNHHRTGASNGPTEGLNLCVKRIKLCVLTGPRDLRSVNLAFGDQRKPR